MKHFFRFSTILFGVLWTVLVSNGIAQTKVPYLKISDMKVEETFEHLQSFLLEKDYFIQAIDSKSAFVQIRFILKPKSWMKLDNRYTVNFLVQDDDENNSKIRLQINREALKSVGRANDNWSYHYRDEGMLKDNEKLYDDLIAELKAFYDAI